MTRTETPLIVALLASHELLVRCGARRSRICSSFHRTRPAPVRGGKKHRYRPIPAVTIFYMCLALVFPIFQQATTFYCAFMYAQ
ncbi:hypothetical protein BDA96_06G213900 [Sorghum bicolor]|uniref:Uncharacterized protein n=1 Tax=Sorghum bicolor TaxID=4558 RepID=A0A921QRT2_SORBI|nr:hypothetical protein BDA96_06G213900 [Sorghum bicolor]